MDSLLRDLKLSARSLLKRPVLTITAVVTLALGIGANTAMFTLLNAHGTKPQLAPIDSLLPLGEGPGMRV